MAALLVGVLTLALTCRGAAPGRPARRRSRQRDVLQPAHMARFGSELFSKHLLSVEVAGALVARGAGRAPFRS